MFQQLGFWDMIIGDCPVGAGGVAATSEKD